ncbi:MAG: four helix bundle protein [Patescibacteria group bacterium]
MRKFKFLDWQVYKDSRDLFSEILKIVKKLPKEYRFELGSQVIRSSLSITLNIAEGSGKESDKELVRFIEISLGSAYETLACLDSMRNSELITLVEFNNLQEKISSVCNQLGGLKKKVVLTEKL